MAKNNVPATPLSFVELVMRADAETLRQALEARVKIDGLLAEREEAYRRIAALENQVEDIVGTPGAFVFPAPPLPVSGFAKAAAVSAPSTSVPAPKRETGSSSAEIQGPAVTEMAGEDDSIQMSADGLLNHNKGKKN